MPAPKARFVRPPLWLHGVDEHQADFEDLRFKADCDADSERYGAIADFHGDVRAFHESQDRAKIVQTLILNRAFGRRRDAQRPPPILAAAVTDTAPNAEDAAVTDTAPNAEDAAAPTQGIVEVSLSCDEESADEESAATTAAEARAAVPDKNDASVPEHIGSRALARAMRKWPRRWWPRRRTKKETRLASSEASAQNKRKNVPLAARFSRCSPSSEAATEQNTKDPVLERDRRALARIKARARWPPAKQRQFYIKLASKKRELDARKSIIIQIAESQRDEHERGLRERALSEQEFALRRQRLDWHCRYWRAPWHCTPWKCNPIYMDER